MYGLLAEGHAPYVGSAFGVAALRHEIDVLAVVAPHWAKVVGGMVGELSEVCAVEAAYEKVGVGIYETWPLQV